MWNVKRQPSKPGPSDNVFAKLVYSGVIHSAIRYISEKSSGGVLASDQLVRGNSKTVQDILLEKHPQARVPPAHVLLEEEAGYINPIVFEHLDA